MLLTHETGVRLPYGLPYYESAPLTGVHSVLRGCQPVKHDMLSYPNGRGNRLKPDTVRVRISQRAPLPLSSEEEHTLDVRDVVGSIPTEATIYG
jgi:hypothetical protein